MKDFIKQVRNKWTGKLYKVLEVTNNEVTLRREDGSEFTIAKTEFSATYSDLRNQ